MLTVADLNILAPDREPRAPSASDWIHDDGTVDLKSLRKNIFKMRLKEFADVLDVSPHTVRSWETRGKVSGPGLALVRRAIDAKESAELMVAARKLKEFMASV